MWNRGGMDNLTYFLKKTFQNKENIVKAKKDESFLQLVEKIKEESHV